MSLADRTFFQMDKATPANQIFLWNHRKRRQDSNMDRSVCLCTGCYHPETPPSEFESLHNFTNFECYDF